MQLFLVPFNISILKKFLILKISENGKIVMQSIDIL